MFTTHSFINSMIRQDSKPDSFDQSRAREDYVYQGYKNSLMYLRRYYAEYHCTFNLRFFPFDEQVCKMEFKARTVTRQYLELLPGRLNYKGPEVLVEFIVSNTNMTTARGQSMSLYPNLIALYPDSIWIKFSYTIFNLFSISSRFF